MAVVRRRARARARPKAKETKPCRKSREPQPGSKLCSDTCGWCGHKGPIAWELDIFADQAERVFICCLCQHELAETVVAAAMVRRELREIIGAGKKDGASRGRLALSLKTLNRLSDRLCDPEGFADQVRLVRNYVGMVLE